MPGRPTGIQTGPETQTGAENKKREGGKDGGWGLEGEVGDEEVRQEKHKGKSQTLKGFGFPKHLREEKEREREREREREKRTSPANIGTPKT